jgi:hypothetical protein
MSFGWNFQNHIFSMKFKGDVFISKKLLFHPTDIEPKKTEIGFMSISQKNATHEKKLENGFVTSRRDVCEGWSIIPALSIHKLRLPFCKHNVKYSFTLLRFSVLLFVQLLSLSILKLLYCQNLPKLQF